MNVINQDRETTTTIKPSSTTQGTQTTTAKPAKRKRERERETWTAVQLGEMAEFDSKNNGSYSISDLLFLRHLLIRMHGN